MSEADGQETPSPRVVGAGVTATNYLMDLPVEVAQFLAREPPQSLVIRGPPGTGKSSMAVAMFNAFSTNRVYVSSRVQRAEILREFPSLGYGPATEFVDGTSGLDSVRAAAEMMEHLREFLAHPRREAEARSLWIPDSLQEAYSRVSPDRPGVVIIDSWDALIERYLGAPGESKGGLPDRPEIERLVLDQMARSPISVVLVLERSDASQLDYLANAVLETGWAGGPGREIRWVHLRKIRGVRVNTRTYPFTLDGGSFHCIGPMPVDFHSRLHPPDPDPDPHGRGLWPGSRDLADAFGRLPIGGITMLECAPSVQAEWIREVYAPVMSHVAQSGGRIVGVLPPEYPLADMARSFRHLIPHDQFLEQVRVQPIGTPVYPPDELQQVVLPRAQAEPDAAGEQFQSAIRFLEGAKPGICNAAVIWVTGLLPLESGSGTPPPPGSIQAALSAYTRRAPIHIVFVVPTASAFRESIRPISTIHISVWTEAGRVFLAGERPATHTYAFTTRDDTEGYRLLPVV